MITLDHVKQAIEMAEAGEGFGRKYDQKKWDCGTACCVAGFASLIATGQPQDSPMPRSFGEQSPTHSLLRALMWIPDARILPIMRAVAFSEDLQAAVTKSGLPVFFPKDGETITPKDKEYYFILEGSVNCVNQVDGKCSVHGTAALHCDSQVSGECNACDTSVIFNKNMQGGQCIGFSRSSIHLEGQQNGHVVVYDNAKLFVRGENKGWYQSFSSHMIVRE